MNTEIKQKWLTALRSGEYKQGRGNLHYKDEYCCLGVLCDLHAKETNSEWTNHDDYPYKYFYSTQLLPQQVCEWSGIDISLTVERDLICLNDSAGKSFNEIADFIEEKL